MTQAPQQTQQSQPPQRQQIQPQSQAPQRISRSGQPTDSEAPSSLEESQDRKRKREEDSSETQGAKSDHVYLLTTRREQTRLCTLLY